MVDLFVTNFPHNTTADEMKEVFAKFGFNVARVNVVRSRRNIPVRRPFALVCVEHENCTYVIGRMRGTILNGSPIRVEKMLSDYQAAERREREAARRTETTQRGAA